MDKSVLLCFKSKSPQEIKMLRPLSDIDNLIRLRNRLFDLQLLYRKSNLNWACKVTIQDPGGEVFEMEAGYPDTQMQICRLVELEERRLISKLAEYGFGAESKFHPKDKST